MARPRKAQRFSGFFADLEVSDLKVLKKEVASEISIREKKVERKKGQENAKKIRDKIRIGNVVNFTQRMEGGPIIRAEVVGIFANKIQVLVEGRKRSISIFKVKSVEP